MIEDLHFEDENMKLSRTIGWQHHVTLCFSILTSEVSLSIHLSRSILIVWAIITIVVGSFIFGQSTTIAVMELLNKYWTPQPTMHLVTSVWLLKNRVSSSCLHSVNCLLQNVLFVVFPSTFCWHNTSKDSKSFFVTCWSWKKRTSTAECSWFLINPQGCVCYSHLFFHVFVLCVILKCRIKATFWLKYSVWLEWHQGAVFNRIIYVF